MDKAFFCKETGDWGVGDDTSVLYDSGFTKEQAEAIADMENGPNPPATYSETLARLERFGLGDK